MYAIFKDDLMNQARDVFQLHQRFESNDLSTEQLNAQQLSQLKHVLGYVTNYSPFYKKHFSGLTETDIHQMTLEAIQRLPFTTKQDLREQGAAMASAPLHRSWVYYETTGTTGSPTPCPRNEIDSIHNNTPLIIRYKDIFRQHGEHHIVGVMGPTELHSTGDTFEDVMRSLGHSVVKMWPRSPVVGMERVMKLISELQLTALVCTPAVAISLARYLKDAGISPAETSVRLILTLGELTTPALLRNIGEVWGAKIYNCMYASQESSILAVCNHESELCTVPLNNFYEVIHPETGKPMPLTGTTVTGELVITNLYQGQKPLIRYRTGDMVRAMPQPNGALKIIPIGRVRDVLLLDGIQYCAWDIESALLDQLSGCLDYAIRITREEGKDRLHVTVELLDDSVQASTILNSVRRHMQEKLNGVQVQIEIGKTSALTGTSAMVSWKAARLHDLRPDGDNDDRNAALALLNRGFQ